MKSYKIIRHPRVEQDLFDILDLIANYAGREIAVKKLSQIEETIKSLQQTPHKGTIRSEIHSNLRTVPTARKGVVCFFINEELETVEIVAIAYAGAEWSRMVNKRKL